MDESIGPEMVQPESRTTPLGKRPCELTGLGCVSFLCTHEELVRSQHYEDLELAQIGTRFQLIVTRGCCETPGRMSSWFTLDASKMDSWVWPGSESGGWQVEVSCYESQSQNS